MVGKCLWVSTEQGSLQGELVEITDYDLLFRKVSATNLPWEHISPLPGGSMIMEKMAVKQVKEVPKNG